MPQTNTAPEPRWIGLRASPATRTCSRARARSPSASHRVVTWPAAERPPAIVLTVPGLRSRS